MTPKKTKKAASKKPVAKKHEETATTGEASESVEAMATTANAQPPQQIGDIVVFAFRLARSERDEIHAATGSAKASKFIRTLALAGARGDMKAVQEAIDEVHAASK